MVAGAVTIAAPAAWAMDEPGAPASVSALGRVGNATVSWKPPADAGTAVTGYTVSASDGSVYKVAPDVRAKRFSGLIGNTDYTFTVRAENADGQGPAVSAKLIGTRIMLNAISSPVRYGTSVRITGQAYRSDGGLGKSWTVKLQGQRKGTTNWGAIAYSKTTWNHGVFAFTQTPSANYSYRVVYSSDNTKYLGSVSDIRSVNVRPAVTAAFNDSSVPSGQPVSFSGGVRPGHAGQTVVLQSYWSGSWRNTGLTAKLNSSSAYSFTGLTFEPGEYSFRAYLPGHADHYAGYSPARKLVVS